MCDFQLIILFYVFKYWTWAKLYKKILEWKIFSKWSPSFKKSAREFKQEISIDWEQVHGKVG